MWLTVLPFLTRNWRLVAAGFALITALTLLAAERSSLIHKGQAKEQTAEAARVVKAEAHVVKREAAATAISDDAGAKLQLARNQIHDLTLKLQARARTDVQAKDDAACRVPPDYSLLYNAAASSGDSANLSPSPR